MKLQYLRCFLLLTSFIGVSKEKRLVYQESYVLLFENVIADNPEKDVSLYINGAKQPSLIVIFRFGNGAITAEWRMDNYTKIFMDANRNIRIANIDKSYEGKYYIQSSGRREVELTISDSFTDEVEKIAKRLDDKQEVIMKYLDNLTDEVEKIAKRLDDKQEVIMKYLGSCDSTKAMLTVVIFFLVVSLPHHVAEMWKIFQNVRFWCRKRVKTSERKGMHESNQRAGTDHLLPREDDTDSEAINISEGTDPLLARVNDTDSDVMNISGGTDPDLPRGADPHSPRLPPPDMNISGGTDPDLPRGADPHLRRLPPPDMNISEGTDHHLPREPDAHLPVGIDLHLPTELAAKMNSSENEDDFLPTAQGRKKIDIRKT